LIKPALPAPLPQAQVASGQGFIRYHLMRLKMGEDLPYLITGKNTKRAIASPEEVLALRPERASAG
jgi:hypothetical protein